MVFLLDHGATPNAADEGGRTPLFGVEDCRKDLIELLESRGGDIRAKSKDGWTALHWAAPSDDERIDAGERSANSGGSKAQGLPTLGIVAPESSIRSSWNPSRRSAGGNLRIGGPVEASPQQPGQVGGELAAGQGELAAGRAGGGQPLGVNVRPDRDQPRRRPGQPPVFAQGRGRGQVAGRQVERGSAAAGFPRSAFAPCPGRPPVASGSPGPTPSPSPWT